MDLRIELDFDFSFEGDLLLWQEGKKWHSQITIKKRKADQYGLRGGDHIRVALVRNGDVAVFEKKVSEVKTKTGTSFRISVPKDIVERLNLFESQDRSVRVMIKVLKKQQT